jgi:hypothetical protein
MKIFGLSLTMIIVLFVVFMLGKHSNAIMARVSGAV